MRFTFYNFTVNGALVATGITGDNVERFDVISFHRRHFVPDKCIPQSLPLFEYGTYGLNWTMSIEDLGRISPGSGSSVPTPKTKFRELLAKTGIPCADTREHDLLSTLCSVSATRQLSRGRSVRE